MVVGMAYYGAWATNDIPETWQPIHQRSIHLDDPRSHLYIFQDR